MSLIEVKLRPTGPWRVGDRAGHRDRVDVIYHSDALYSAVTHAMRALGWLDEWLDATARATGMPAVRFSSLFPFVGKTRLVAPPKSVWPPAQAGKLYLQGAKLIPLEIVRSGLVEESRWQVEGESECLVPMGGSAPFRIAMRAAAAVDRWNGNTEPHRTACLEFAPNAGWWGVFEVSDAAWESRAKAALRLLADSGFGGERSRGWGRAGEPQFSEASHLFRADNKDNGKEGMLWLLSLYSPHESDAVDWSRSEYSVAVRGGWTDSVAGAGAKKQVRMIDEGSVLSSPALRGHAVDVAPDGFAHSVYRAGFALAMAAPAEIAVRTVESTRPARVTPTAPEAPVAVPGEAESVQTPAEAVSAKATEEAEAGVEAPVTAPETEPAVAPDPFGEAEPEISGSPVETPVVPEAEAESAPVETETPAEANFEPGEPLVTPGDEAVSAAVPEEMETAVAAPATAAETEAAVPPDPFGEMEPEISGNSVETPVVPATEEEPAPVDMVTPAEADFAPEEPLVTPGDDAVSGTASESASPENAVPKREAPAPPAKPDEVSE